MTQQKVELRKESGQATDVPLPRLPPEQSDPIAFMVSAMKNNKPIEGITALEINVGVVEKVSILKRGRALGVTLVTNEQDVTLQSEPQLRARMTMLLGGRGAEALVLKTASTGAANDLEHVSNMAYRMVTEFGFSKTIGPFSYAGLPDRERQAGGGSEAVTEARETVKDIERQCAELLLANREALGRLTAELLEHETVSGEIVEASLFPHGAPVALAA